MFFIIGGFVVGGGVLVDAQTLLSLIKKNIV